MKGWWRLSRFRLAAGHRTYDAPPWGVRVVNLTKSRKVPTHKKKIPPLCRSGVQPHAHKAAWNALVHGRKRWFMFAAPLFNESFAPSDSALHWFQTQLPRLRGSPNVFEFIQEAGEVVWVPSGWTHAVLNLEPSVAVSKQTLWGYPLPTATMDSLSLGVAVDTSPTKPRPVEEAAKDEGIQLP